SWTSSPRSGTLRDESAQVAPEQPLREVLRELAEHLQLHRSLLTPLRVPRAQSRCDERLEQIGLPVGGRAELSQVPRREPETRQLAARRRDVCVRLGIEPLPTFDTRLQQAEVLELARELRVDLRPLAELAEVELALLSGKAAVPAAPALLH